MNSYEMILCKLSGVAAAWVHFHQSISGIWFIAPILMENCKIRCLSIKAFMNPYCETPAVVPDYKTLVFSNLG